MNDNSMKHTPTPIENKITEVLENQLTEAMSRAYNQGVEHSIAVIQDMRERLKTGNPVENMPMVNLMDAAITLLVNLKK